MHKLLLHLTVADLVIIMIFAAFGWWLGMPS